MTAPLDTDVAIETPEHIVFRHRLAGPARRFFAYLVDVMICYSLLAVLLVVIVVAAAGTAGVGGTVDSAVGAGIGIWLVLLFAAEWVYFVVFETLRGATPGKRALGLRVVTTTGRPIGFRAAALRNILRAADSLPLPAALGLFSVAGLASMVMSGRFQRLGDLVAGTMVVIPEHAEIAGAIRLVPPAQPTELAALPDEVTLDVDERHAIELFLRRRPRLGRARELELAKILADPLSERLRVRESRGHVADASRLLALVYDRAANAGRAEAPLSSRAGSRALGVADARRPSP